MNGAVLVYPLMALIGLLYSVRRLRRVRARVRAVALSGENHGMAFVVARDERNAVIWVLVFACQLALLAPIPDAPVRGLVASVAFLALLLVSFVGVVVEDFEMRDLHL